MRKTYYFNSNITNFVCLFIAVLFILVLIIAFITKNNEESKIIDIIIIVCFVIVASLLYIVGFSFSMRIEVDFKYRYLYIKHPYLIKRIKFNDIISIEIENYKETALLITVNTKIISQQITYSRYSKKKLSEKITNKLKELKADLYEITKAAKKM